MSESFLEYGGHEDYESFTENYESDTKGRSNIRNVPKDRGFKDLPTDSSSVLPSNKTCPICRQPSRFTCVSESSDSKCKNGHVWHTNQQGQVKIGPCREPFKIPATEDYEEHFVPQTVSSRIKPGYNPTMRPDYQAGEGPDYDSLTKTY